MEYAAHSVTTLLCVIKSCHSLAGYTETLREKDRKAINLERDRDCCTAKSARESRLHLKESVEHRLSHARRRVCLSATDPVANSSLPFFHYCTGLFNSVSDIHNIHF